MKQRVLVLLLLCTLFLTACAASAASQAPSAPPGPPPPRNDAAIAAVSRLPVEYPFRFVLMGDVRPGSYEKVDNPLFTALTRQIVQLDPDPSFVVVLGDLTMTGARRLYTEAGGYLDVIDSLPVPVFSVVGNHELLVPEGRQNFTDFFGPTEYYFDYGNTRFVVVDDSGNGQSSTYGLSESQMDWMASALQDVTHPVKIVLMHVPLNQNHRGYARYKALMEKYGVALVARGDLHQYERKAENGVTYLITGGGGAELYRLGEDPPDRGAMHHFVNVKMEASGEGFAQVIKLGDGAKPDPRYDFRFRPGGSRAGPRL